MTHIKLLSIVIPLYNEEASIPLLKQELLRLLEVLRNRNQDYEIIFINDGSLDGTEQKLKEYFDIGSRMRIVTHPKNRGIGAALKTGLNEASGDYILTLESDCTCPPIFALTLLDSLDESIDIVIGSPYHPAGNVEDVHPFRLFLSQSLSRIYRLILPKKLWTYTNFFRLYRTSSIRGISTESNGFLCVSEILIKAILAGRIVKEIPMVLKRRKHGSSKMKIISVIRDHLKLIAKIIISKEKTL